MVRMISKTQFLMTILKAVLKQISRDLTAMIAAFIHTLLTLVVILDVLGRKSMKVVILDDPAEDIIFTEQTYVTVVLK